MALDKFVQGLDADYDETREFTALIRKIDALRCDLFQMHDTASDIAGRVFGPQSEDSSPDSSPKRRDGALGAVDLMLHECQVAARNISEQLSRLDHL